MLPLISFAAGCADGKKTIDVRAATEAAAQKAIADDRPKLPPLPGECYIDTAHAPMSPGQETAIAARREYSQLDIANDKRYRCASFYNTLRKNSGQTQSKGAADG